MCVGGGGCGWRVEAYSSKVWAVNTPGTVGMPLPAGGEWKGVKGE